MISFVYISKFFRKTALRFSFTAEAQNPVSNGEILCKAKPISLDEMKWSQRSRRSAETLFLCVSIFPHLFVTHLNQIFKTSASLRDLCASAPLR
jgi:hypothetical protein